MTARRPAVSTSWAVSANRTSSRATSATSAPARAYAAAMARPIPREAPVTSARLPVRSVIGSLQVARPVGTSLWVSYGPSHAVGSGAAPGTTAATTSSKTRRTNGSPTHRCLAPSTATTRACGMRANRSTASSGRR